MNNEGHPQLALRLVCKPHSDFASFVQRGNEQIVHRLRFSVANPNSSWIYLWGNAGSGKSHLLQAACQEAEMRKLKSFYLAPAELAEWPIRIFDDLEAFDVVAIDDLQMLSGNAAAEEALFHLYNRLRDQGKLLLVAASDGPRHLALELPDLSSRLSAMEVYQVSALDDAGRMEALILWAQHRGFRLSQEVASFILRRSDRTLPALLQIIENLDQQSLREKRLITLPFVKKVLGC